MRTLTVSGIIRNGYATGLKNAASLVGAVILWSLTCWIPYLNVGTTIGLLGLVSEMGKGNVISPTAIFASKFRKQMGSFFLVIAFTGLGTLAGALFGGIPGIVIALSWSLAPLLVIDRGLNPSEALQKSNDLTSGRKWTIVFGSLLTSFTVLVVVGLLAMLGSKVHVALGALISLVGMVVSLAVGMGSQAYVYGVLTESRPADPSDEGSAALSWGSAAAAVVGMILIGVVGALGGRSTSAADFDANSFRMPDAAPMAARAKQVKPAPAPVQVAAEDVAEPAPAPAVAEVSGPPVRIQAPALAAEFLKNRSRAKASFDGKMVEVTGLVKTVQVDAFATTVYFEVPEVEGKFDALSAMVIGKASIRQGQVVTVRGAASVQDFAGLTVTLPDAELVRAQGSVAAVGKKRGRR
jgi:hypothetical protein